MEKNILFDDGKTSEQRQKIYDAESNQPTYGEKMRDLQKWRKDLDEIVDPILSTDEKIQKIDDLVLQERNSAKYQYVVLKEKLTQLFKLKTTIKRMKIS